MSRSSAAILNPSHDFGRLNFSILNTFVKKNLERSEKLLFALLIKEISGLFPKSLLQSLTNAIPLFIVFIKQGEVRVITVRDMNDWKKSILRRKANNYEKNTKV